MNKKHLSKALKTMEELQNIQKPKIFIVDYTDGTSEKLTDVTILIYAIKQSVEREADPDYKAFKKITYKSDKQSKATLGIVTGFLTAAGEPDPEIVEV